MIDHIHKQRIDSLFWEPTLDGGLCPAVLRPNAACVSRVAVLQNATLQKLLSTAKQVSNVSQADDDDDDDDWDA